MTVSRTLVAALAAEAVVMLLLLTLALDQYAHAKGDMADGLNSWGYRGAVAKERAYVETRLLMVGGTRAFQPGVPVADTTIQRIRFMTEQWVTFDRGPVTAFNLGLPGLARGAYAGRLETFRYLSPDLICVYVDLTAGTSSMPVGLITKVTGYVPAQPVLAGIDRQLGRIAASAPQESDDMASIAAAVDTALSMTSSVIVAVPEPVDEGQRQQREELRASLSRFSSNARVAVVDLKDGPPAVWLSLMQPADAIQLDPAVRRLLQAQRSYR